MSAAEKYQKDHNVKFTTGTQLALAAEAKAKAGLNKATANTANDWQKV